MSRLSFVAFVVLVLGVLHAQEQPTVRAGGSFVRVDAHATADGKPVDDLTAAELEVLEDGVPQAIESFDHIDGRSSGPQSSKVFVVFLDTYHTTIESSSNLRLPLVRFLDRLIGPDDQVALLTSEQGGSPITFGRKATVISDIMQSEWTWGRTGRLEERDQQERLYDACFGAGRSAQTGVAGEMKARRREKAALDALEDVTTRLSGVRDGRKAVLLVSDGWQLFRANPNLASAERTKDKPADILRRQPRSTPADGQGTAGVNRAECEADRVALSQMDHTQRLREMAEQGNRDLVTFYPLSAGGLGAVEKSTETSATDSLRFLADNTDGIALLASNEVEGALTRITDDLSSYYVLGYTSSNTKLDGRFRTVSVRAKRAGVRVRTRRGYRGRTADELISGSTSLAPGRTSTTRTPPSTGGGPVTATSQFRIRTSSWARSPVGGEPTSGFWLVGEIDFRTRRELAWTSGARAEVTVLAADGTAVTSRTMNVRTEDGPFAFQVPESGGLPSGEYAVRVQLTSDADAAQTLTETARVVLNGGNVLGEAVLWRRGPTTGLQHRRTADARFQRSDRLRLELPTTVPGAAKARLLDRNGAPLSVPVQVQARDDTSGGFHWIVVDATLAPMAPGDYAIEVVQGTAKQLTTFRLVP